jgi:hypothetical protein
LSDNLKQNKKQKRTQESLGSLYRKTKTEIDRETERIDLTELSYSTTRLGKAEGSNSLKKQITDSEKTKTKQTRLLRPG